MTATARLEIRLRPESKSALERAAAFEDVAVSDFVRSAVEARIEEVLRQHEQRTVVPATFFDDLLAALDDPPKANVALVRAAKRADTFFSE
jgi:uncharacterized protein (DUF1778 family)